MKSDKKPDNRSPVQIKEEAERWLFKIPGVRGVAGHRGKNGTPVHAVGQAAQWQLDDDRGEASTRHECRDPARREACARGIDRAEREDRAGGRTCFAAPLAPHYNPGGPRKATVTDRSVRPRASDPPSIRTPMGWSSPFRKGRRVAWPTREFQAES
jgi:hypothetical protein